jgi:DNA replication protein DnaC
VTNPTRRPASEQEREFWRSQALTAAQRDLNRIPARYTNATIDNPDVDAWVTAVTNTAIALADGWREPVIGRGPSLLLVGATGTGKTYQAYAAVRALLTSGIRCAATATTAADMYASLRPRFGVDSEDEFARYAGANVLVLDDLGAAKGTEWNEEINYRLVNHRYEHELATIFTSNIAPKDLPEALGQRVSSRLFEMTSTVALKGADRRTS